MSQCLVIGYGNTLRSDDGVGVEVAQAIAAMNLPSVEVITRHQLVPELAAAIARAHAVIFVDADVSANGQPELRPIEAVNSSQIMAHATSPHSLLALSRDIFGNCPKAWVLSIPVENFNFGFGLSPRSQAGARIAVKLIQDLLVKLANIA